MEFYKKVNKVVGTAIVRVEGFFTERLINLCKIQGIKIWNVKNITPGMVEFDIALKDVKKIRGIVKKCKCKLNVIKKEGLYFKAFKYRKRKLVLLLLALFIIAINLYNKFIWNIEIEGNELITKEEILTVAENSGIHIGAFKPKIDTNYIKKCMQRDIEMATWVGIDIKGTTVIIRVMEKTTIPENIIYDKSKTGSIIANKSGVITKIIAENGTAVHGEGSYVEEGMVLIQGKMQSEILGDISVRASGIVKMNVEYIMEEQYMYSQTIKEYIGKNKYNIGFSVNDKEIYINYLNKSKKYDKLKSSKGFDLFGAKFSLDFYKFDEYIEKEVKYSYDDLLSFARNDKNEYIASLTSATSILVYEKEEIQENENGISYKSIITINENVGVFKGD